MKTITTAILALTLMAVPNSLGAQDEHLGLHEDYYLGFSQGAFYGLMLAGVDYDVAWCVKGELDYEADKLGAGGEFQENIERIYKACGEGQ